MSADGALVERPRHEFHLHVDSQQRGETVRKRLLEVQRRWLKDRNDCGGDARCLNAVYDQRLNELRAIELPS